MAYFFHMYSPFFFFFLVFSPSAYGFFPDYGSNPCPLYCRQILIHRTIRKVLRNVHVLKTTFKIFSYIFLTDRNLPTFKLNLYFF